MEVPSTLSCLCARSQHHLTIIVDASDNMSVEQYGKPELWGWYSSAYNHVAFAQLFGRMIDLPAGWPRYTRDLKHWCDALSNPRLPE